MWWEFKQRFYPRGWARYEQAQPGTFKLIPEGHVFASAESDYRSMEAMIFGEVPDFDELMMVLQKLQVEINA